MNQKRVFATIFLLLTLLLIILPFLVSFNEVLTKFFESFRLYTWIQERLVPIEVQIVTVIVGLIGIHFTPHYNGMTVNGTFLGMTWNCIGWQSLILLIITLLTGLTNGNYTLLSKIEAIAIGLLGTFLINILRLSFIVILFVLFRPLFAFVFHDYLAAFVTIFWLFFFWWFAYKYVLEEKSRIESNKLI